MHVALAAHQSLMDDGAANWATYHLDQMFRIAAGRYRAKAFAVVGPQPAERSAAEAVRLFQDRIEHRREFALRGIDDAEHFRRRRLLLQRLPRLGEEPRVLHRDSLRREILQQ